jgi:hypothetical protein
VIYHATHNNGLTVISNQAADKKPLPSLPRMALNFAKAIAGHIASGGKHTPLPLLEARLAVCSLCEQRNEEKCGVCGCPVTKDNGEGKAQWLDQDCPLARWPKQEIA